MLKYLTEERWDSDKRGKVMSEVWIPKNKKSKYYITKEDYLTALHWCRRYPQWKRELAEIPITVSSSSFDKPIVSSSPSGSQVENIAMQRVEISEKVMKLENTIALVAPELFRFLLLGVTRGYTYEQLRKEGIPCGHRQYYEARRRFYYYISKKI